MQHQNLSKNHGNVHYVHHHNYHHLVPQMSLPSFKEFMDKTFSEHQEQEQQHSNNDQTISTIPYVDIDNSSHVMFNTNNTCMQSEDHFKVETWGIDASKNISFPLTSIHNNQDDDTLFQANVMSKITSLEIKLNMQEVELSRLKNENQHLKRKRKHEMSLKSTKKKSNNNMSNSFNLISENDLSGKYREIISGNIEEYKVTWESMDYIILNAFNDRDEIFNYYCPLFETKFPDKFYKLVLERDDYKKLFKENVHLRKFFKSHAWRISIFSIEFFEFVKKCKNP